MLVWVQVAYENANCPSRFQEGFYVGNKVYWGDQEQIDAAFDSFVTKVSHCYNYHSHILCNTAILICFLTLPKLWQERSGDKNQLFRWMDFF